MGLPDLLPWRGWAVVVTAALVAAGAPFVGPSVTGLSVLVHLLVVGVVQLCCVVAVLATVFRYTTAEHERDAGEWRFDP